MKIFVDADACPVVHIVEKLAKKYEMSFCHVMDFRLVWHLLQ